MASPPGLERGLTAAEILNRYRDQFIEALDQRVNAGPICGAMMRKPPPGCQFLVCGRPRGHEPVKLATDREARIVHCAIDAGGSQLGLPWYEGQ
ncbi:hypothetical protein GCM10009534_74610 [Kribbella sandramycini]